MTREEKINRLATEEVDMLRTWVELCQFQRLHEYVKEQYSELSDVAIDQIYENHFEIYKNYFLRSKA